jgi:hypothetical protein
MTFAKKQDFEIVKREIKLKFGVTIENIDEM